MITVKRLKELLAKIPNHACVYVYEGEKIGISIQHGNQFWWIGTRLDAEEDNDNDGFENELYFEEEPCQKS